MKQECTQLNITGEPKEMKFFYAPAMQLLWTTKSIEKAPVHIYERCLEVNPLESQQEKNNDDIYHRSRASWKQESSNFCGKRLFDAIGKI
jgi:hypothetical protein